MTQIKNIFLLIIAAGLSTSVLAQKGTATSYEIRDIDVSELNTTKPAAINTIGHRLVKIDIQKLQNIVKTVDFEINNVSKATEISLPSPDGLKHTYMLVRNTTMHPDLAAKFPLISTYNAYGISHPEENGKVEVTPTGLHAMIKSTKENTFFIDPYNSETTEDYLIYSRDNMNETRDFTCNVEDVLIKSELQQKSAVSFSDCRSRKYRIAVAATGEYTNYHGGTVAQGLAAQVITMDRVNSVYEQMLAITFEMIADNDLLVFTNSSTDGYTNGDAGQMISANGNIINTALSAVGGGSGSYDIGHVFATAGAGLAGFQVVCGGSKASGVTGIGDPVGDPFDIDYVCHEIGHQFGGSHTQNNNCNKSSFSVEPGSGSTIMGYANICPPNVQGFSDDHFHGVNVQQIANFIGSTSCATTTTLVNNVPVITTTTPNNVNIPSGTPFILSAEATDADAGDILLYQWDQMDPEKSVQPPSRNSDKGPNFRSFSPSETGTRYLPRLDELRKGNGEATWEVIADVAREYNFRLIVKDNHALGSCNDHKDITVNVDGNTGPFVVAYPNAFGITWYQGSPETILWDVAGTDGAPINCAEVDILMSTDNGLTYPDVLATNVPNSGSFDYTVTADPTLFARIMVVCSDQRFFNISNSAFEISADSPPPVSVQEQENNQFKIYPNPSKETLNVFLKDVKDTELSILDLTGKVVYNTVLKNQKNSIDVSGFITGMYFVQLKNDSSHSTTKIIKE